VIFWVIRPWEGVTTVLDEHVASVFRVEVSQVLKVAGYLRSGVEEMRLERYVAAVFLIVYYIDYRLP
jgi:hypothetical protein